MSRRSIEVEGLGHGGIPIPAASRVANILMTGGVSGVDPRTHEFPADAQEQVAQMFANLRGVLAAGGASPGDVVKLSVAVADLGLREAINREWVAMFPDPASRPARHVTRYAYFAGGMQVQCEAYAVLAQREDGDAG